MKKTLFDIEFKIENNKNRWKDDFAWVEYSTGEIFVTPLLLHKYKKYLPFFLFHEQAHLIYPDSGSTFEDEYVAYCYAIRKAVEHKLPIPWSIMRKRLDKCLFSLLRNYYKKLKSQKRG